MKRTFSLLATCCLLSFAVACGEEPSGSDSTASPTEEPTETSTPIETPTDTPTEEPTEGTDGGGFTPSGDRPSVEELTQYIYEDFNGSSAAERQMAECMAQIYYDSEISDAGLREFVDDYDNWEPEMDDAFAFLDAATESLDCIPGASPDDLDFDFGN